MERTHKITAQTKHYKLLLLTLYVVMAIAFWGCQNKEIKKTEIKNAKVVSDTLPPKTVVLDQKVINKKESDKTPPPPQKVKEVKFQKPTAIANTEIIEEKISKESKPKKEDVSSTMKPLSNSNAEFPGGIEQFHNFFMKEYKKPEGVSYWKLNFNLAFAVEKNGSVSFLECSPAVDEPLQQEIIRVLNLCPKWQPGESNGKKIRMQYSVPILLK